MERGIMVHGSVYHITYTLTVPIEGKHHMSAVWVKYREPLPLSTQAEWAIESFRGIKRSLRMVNSNFLVSHQINILYDEQLKIKTF